jgi:hypothetical protein
MSVYRTYWIKRGTEISGPFPELVVCQQILIGRIQAGDLLSLDTHAWKDFRQIEEINATLQRLLEPDTVADDVEWRDERAKAALRHYDERKYPDRRIYGAVDQPAVWVSRRQSGDRRHKPETVEEHAYRLTYMEVDSELRRSHFRIGWSAVLLLLAALPVGLALYAFHDAPVIDLGLASKVRGNCAAAPLRGTDWHGCDKSGYLMVGADLRDANLANVNFTGANLSYADLSGADIRNTQFNKAILSGAKWVDGKTCAQGSIGLCK